MNLEIRPIEAGEYEAWMHAAARSFGALLLEDDLSLRRPTVELDRTLAVLEDGEFVGEALAYSMEMTVPSGCLPTAVVDYVAVQPTHRRRGILNKIMDRQLRDFHERGEPLAILEASESIIYGRFGYGVGSLREDWTIAREHTAFAKPPEQRGRVKFIDKEQAISVLPEVYRRAVSERPGMIIFSEAWWDFFLADPETVRRGASAFFHVVYEQDGHASGYAIYRIRDHTLIVVGLVAETEEAYASLWRYCLDVDLMSTTQAYARAVDEALPWMLADPRRLQRLVRDHIWVRLVDVGAALSSRRYAQTARVVLEVRDSFCPWNEKTFDLEGSDRDAVCRPTSASPDLVLSAADLATVYLGAVNFTTLAHAGRAEERTQGALSQADAMFATSRQPWSPPYDL